MSIAVPPSGDLKLCTGFIVGQGLAVVRLPETGYTITHVATGYALPKTYFYHRGLAMRCARELIRLTSFDRQTVEEINYAIRPQWERVLKPVVDRYLDFDDMAWNRATNYENFTDTDNV